MKVLCVLDSLAPGGTEQSTLVLIPRLHSLEVEVSIVTLRRAQHDLSDDAQRSGIAVTLLGASSMLGRVRELRRLIRSDRPDVVHTALFQADQVGRLAAWGTGVPVVSSFVSTPYDSARLTDPNVLRWKLRVAQAIDAVTARLMVKRFHAVSVGAAIANVRALRLPQDRVVVAERGRNIEVLGTRSPARRNAARSALGLADDSVVVLSLGRLDHQKGHRVLLDSVPHLVAAHPSLVVLIAGKDGSASADLRRAIDSTPEVAAHVRLLGHRSDVGDLLCAADVLAISSHFEGTAGVAVEAMALSTPIVSTDLEGLIGVLEHDRNAVLVEPNDPRALAEGIGRLIERPDLAERVALAGKNDFDERFTLDAAARRLRAVYECALAR